MPSVYRQYPTFNINVRQLFIGGNTTASQNIRHQSLSDKAQYPRRENSSHTLFVILSTLKHLYNESVKIISSVLKSEVGGLKMKQFKAHCTVLNGSTYSYCGLLDYNTRTHQCLCCRWKQNIPWTHLHPPTELHAVISQRTTIWQYCKNYQAEKFSTIDTAFSYSQYYHLLVRCQYHLQT